MIDWNRQRHPDDVPTPVAVALADFCRRAEATSSPSLVRNALSVLSAEDDFRVRTITDSEPPLSPLGPYAVVDIVRGTSASLASQRQTTGYYALVEMLIHEREKRRPPLAVPAAQTPMHVAAELPEWNDAAARTKEQPAKKAKPLTVQEKIAPKRRPMGDADAEAELPHFSEAPAKKSKPVPRGRFMRVETVKAPYETLLEPRARRTLSSLIDEVSTRVQLRRALENTHSGKRGGMTQGDVDELLKLHGLDERLSLKEVTALLGALEDALGSFAKAAATLDMSVAEFNRLTDQHHAAKSVADVRREWIKKALDPNEIGFRVDLLGRTNYLDDLGIANRFDRALLQDIETHLEAAQDDDDPEQTVAEQFSIPRELLDKTLQRLRKKNAGRA